MNTRLKVALLLGAVTFVAGAGLGYAQMEGPLPPDGPMQGLMRSSDRLADRLLRNFDLNHDGKVTHDEMNRTIGARFAAVTHRAPVMTLEQFIALRAAEFRQHNAEMFKRLDWNADGRLTLADFAGPQHVRFIEMDKDGSGVVSCAADTRPTRGARGDSGGWHSSRGGLAGFCYDNDLNQDGKVTRAELDAAIAKRFSAATGGAPTMNAAQFAASEEERYRASNARTFRRLDRDGNGTLTIQEFAGSELRLFARLDKNRDGILTPDEMRPQFRSRADQSRRAYD